MSYCIKLRHGNFMPYYVSINSVKSYRKYYVSINSVKSYRKYNVVKFDDFSRPKGEFSVLFKAVLNFKDFFL